MSALIARLQSGKGYLISAIIVAGLQTVILGTIIQSRAAILSNGTEVLLKTAPVDPRDFLRGDYVVLNYDISSVPVQTIAGGIPVKPGELTLWVRLKKQEDGFWTVIESAFQSLPPQPETVVLRSLPFYN
ncbi:hypothetical protein RCCGEPOP_10521 [Rhizobium sp. Pop5]|nr:hypothetical protein RCCGEPOP_10521 [Rhizobium sp. Pop5]